MRDRRAGNFQRFTNSLNAKFTVRKNRHFRLFLRDRINCGEIVRS
jgi:hypothetical protein